MVKKYSLIVSFTEVCTVLLLFLTILVTSASAERSFFKLKVIKGYLRSTITQDHLSSIALLSIEQERARNRGNRDKYCRWLHVPHTPFPKFVNRKTR